MTREEAIAFGKRVIDLGFKGETAEFCEMAISALEKNESAEEWYKLFCEKWDSAENKGEPKTGHWIEVIDEIDSFGNKTWHHKCSICGHPNSGWGEYKYCPNCGADMRGE